MAVYVDCGRIPYRRMIMSHMLADSPAELHMMADLIGIDRRWFQPLSTPHYDICQQRRALAIEAGAVVIGRRETVEVIRRIRKMADVDWSARAWPREARLAEPR